MSSKRSETFARDGQRYQQSTEVSLEYFAQFKSFPVFLLMYIVCSCISVVKGCSARLGVTTYIDLFEVVRQSLDLILSWVHIAVERLAFFNPLFVSCKISCGKNLLGIYIVHVVFNLQYYLGLEYLFFPTQLQTLIISPKTWVKEHCTRKS